MSQTPADIIDSSFQALGVTVVGETLPTAVKNAAFVTLNQLVSGASAEWPMAYVKYEQNLTLTAGLDIYTVGTGGSLVTTARPVRITGWQSFSGNFRNGGQAMSFEALHAAVKDLSARRSVLAEMVAVDNNFPSINLQVWPMPDTSPGTLKLDYWAPIPAFSATSDTITMPDGYEAYLISALAMMLAPSYPRIGGVPEALAARAANDKEVILKKNAAILGLQQAA